MLIPLVYIMYVWGREMDFYYFCFSKGKFPCFLQLGAHCIAQSSLGGDILWPQPLE